MMKLSDAFFGEEGDLELCATVLRISEDSNRDILDACEALAGYAHLLALVWEELEHSTPDVAIDWAIQRCIEDGYLVEYLNERRSEVASMLLDAYSEEEAYRLIRRDAEEEGRAEGMREQRAAFLKVARSLVLDGILDVESASERFGFPPDEILGANPNCD